MRKSSEPSSELRQVLLRIDGRPYGAYRDLRGRSFLLGPAEAHFDFVQGDPFASPSRVRLEFAASSLDLPEFALRSRPARRACADHLHRRLRKVLRRAPAMGSGKSGVLEIAALGPEVLDRTAVVVDRTGAVTLRVQVGLPAQGRRIRGRAAAELLFERLRPACESALTKLDFEALRGHVECVEDQVALREQLAEQGLVAFVADGSRLPRRSGVSSEPLEAAIPFASPESLRVSLEAPRAGTVRGLGIPRGVHLIVGGGYHGKSTLLEALSLGIYDHIPGDGRERCVTCLDAVSIRAEDGRAVRGVDLRPFIDGLPMQRSTSHFDTDDASGSTSQAAAIIEAIEAGARLLLIDEDTAATNFMIRDARMRALVPESKEPITPYLDRVRQLHDERGVSSILVVGGSGEYLDVADYVLQMQDYLPTDATERAKQVATLLPLGDAAPRKASAWPAAAPRVPDPRGFDPSKGRRAERVRAVRTQSIEFGSDEIDVSAVAQLVDTAQCRFLGDVLLALARGLCDGRLSVPELLDRIDARLDSEGLGALCEFGFGDRAAVRRFEIASAINRMRSLHLVDT